VVVLPSPYNDTCSEGGCCLDEECSLTLIHVDENRCEDDIYDIYVVRGDGSWRYIEQIDLVSSPAGCCYEDEDGNECPQTEKQVSLTISNDDLNACCRLKIRLEQVGSNCCGTYTRFSIEGPSGAEVFSSYFSGTFEEEFDARELCVSNSGAAAAAVPFSMGEIGIV